MEHSIIDLRSDTLTHPTPEMRAAMASAELGDDQYGEDPTVNKLQVLAAEKLGKEAAIFLPSGTMGNLGAVLAQCNRGDEVILGHLSHIFLLEAGGVAALGGVHSYLLQNQTDGTIPLDAIRNAIRADNPHLPVSRLVALENTHNRCGGTPLSVEYTRQVGELAHQNGLLVHIDGARIFNAAIALGVTAEQLAAPADSITFCLSKGLCCPVGSMLCGSAEFILRMKRVRTQLGGSMRQAGVLAAAGLLGLENMVDRLAEDHRRAYTLAEKLAKIPGLKLKFGLPKTNILFLTLEDGVQMNAPEIARRLQNEKHAVRVHMTGEREFRLLTHYWIDDEAIELAAQTFAHVL